MDCNGEPQRGDMFIAHELNSTASLSGAVWKRAKVMPRLRRFAELSGSGYYKHVAPPELLFKAQTQNRH